MAEFITLTCPTCGGKLQITEDIERFQCSHCGNDHLVKRFGGTITIAKIEIGLHPKSSQYDCPICGDSSSVQKVTEVVDSGKSFEHQTDLSRNLTPPKEESVGCATLGVGFLLSPLILILIVGASSSLWAGLILVAIILGLAILYQSEEHSHSRTQAALKKGMPIHTRSYYCIKHGVVFDPETGKSWPRSEHHKIFWEEIRK
jgi:predicted RNA-binding Zn-ribbon protein involved in translation (DUF1610 family)